jgi:histone-lysine N-methyltransferase SETMAR
MDVSIPNPAKCEVRSVIRFLNAKGEAPAEIHRQIISVYGDVMNRQNVAKWCPEFNAGRTDVHDEQRTGRPSLMNADLVQRVEENFRVDRCVMINELHEMIPEVSKLLVHEIVKEKLDYCKLCARWVPKMLTENHKKNQMGAALTFLTCYSEKGDEFLGSIGRDETWVFHHTPESKQLLMEWPHTQSPTKKKFKTSTSTKKIMATVFWDRKGVLLVDFMPHGTTINTAAYCETLKMLRRAIQNRRREMLTRGVTLLHDNARPHTARATQQLLQSFNWEVLDHPAHSPDLAPSDVHLFLHLKKHLAGQKFHEDEEVKNEVTAWLRAQVAEFYDIVIPNLVPRLTKCLDRGGDYVEK